MSVAYPIFPGFKPGRSFTAPPLPVRAPTWNYKEIPRFQNFRQVAVSGRSTVTKYWSNPLRDFEWKYGYIIDDPTNHNSFYPVAIPHTDFQMLRGFFIAMQGSGTQFAYMPPEAKVGGTWASTGNVQVANNLVTFSTLPAGTATALAGSIGLPLYAFNFATATFLNTKYMYIYSVNTSSNTVTCSFTHGNYGPTTDTGVLTLGQLLADPDANDNTELVVTTGSYPNLTSVQTYAGTVVPVMESVQVIDTATFVLYDGAGTNITGHATLGAPNSITPPLAYTPYVGYVVQLGSYTPAALPLTASFTYFYLCRFSDDAQDFENYLTMLQMASSFRFQQVRI